MSSSDLIYISWDLIGKALAVCAEIWLVTLCKLSVAGFCVWAGLVQLGFVVKLSLGLVITTK